MLEEKINCQLKLRSSTTTTTTIKPFIPKQVRVGKRGNHMSQKKRDNKSEKEGGKQRAKKNQIEKGEEAIKR
jgi:hypothetical protein